MSWGCVWVFLVGFFFVGYSLVCRSGIPFVGCDFMTVDVVDSCMHLFVCCLFSWRYNPLWLYFSQSGSGL